MPNKSTQCRYCAKSDGVIYEGAHHSCKTKALREKQKARGGKLVYEKCKDCGAQEKLNVVGRCQPCQFSATKARKREDLNRWKRARNEKKAQEILATRVCKCGCGRKVKSERSLFATMQCASKVNNAKRTKTPKKAVLPSTWEKPFVMPEVEAAAVADAVVPETVTVTKCEPYAYMRTISPEEIDPAKAAFIDRLLAKRRYHAGV